MLKHAVKRGVSSSLGRLLAGDPSGRVVVLCYHSIHPSASFASASPELFAAHLEWLTAFCDVVRLHDVPALRREAGRSRPAVAVTFDDGYADNHTHALPLLEAAGVPATFFLTAGFLAGDPEVVARMAAIRREPVAALDWAQARELASAGHELGSHTWTHALLSALDSDDVASELVRSRATIEERTGFEVRSFAYPFGKPGRHFRPETARLVAAAGYELAAAVLFRGVRPADSPLALPRFFVARDDVETLAAKVAGRWDWLGIWQERSPRWAARVLSPADFRDPVAGTP